MHKMGSACACAVALFIGAVQLGFAEGDDQGGSLLLQSLLSGSDKKPVGKNEPRQMTLPTEGIVPHEKLSLGVNYTGAQARWNFSPHWAAEARFQEGKSSSNYGDV